MLMGRCLSFGLMNVNLPRDEFARREFRAKDADVLSRREIAPCGLFVASFDLGCIGQGHGQRPRCPLEGQVVARD